MLTSPRPVQLARRAFAGDFSDSFLSVAMMGTIRSRAYFTSVKKFTPVKVFGGVNATHIEYGMRGRGADAYSSGFNGSKAR